MSVRNFLIVAIAVVDGLVMAGCAVQDPKPEPELVLVAGGSGRVGHSVVEYLAEQGRSYRALTRSRADAAERWGDSIVSADWIEGDVRDAQRMTEVMQAVTDVICVIGTRELSGPNSAEFVDYGGVVHLVDAAKTAGVRHFVLLTAIGVTDPKHPFNKATKGALQWRFKGEEYLRASGLDYTIVRPGGLQDRPAGEQGLIISQGDNWKPVLRSTLSRDDLALVLIESLDNPGARNATFEIVNDPRQQPGDWRAALKALRPD